MRRPLLSALCLASLFACEDGPNQTYSTPPPGARNNWNDPQKSGAGNATVTSPFGQSFGGVTAVETCVGDKRRQQLANAFQAPVVPPTKVAGVDLRGARGEADYTGLAIDDAFSADKLCQGETYFDPTDPQYGYTRWGNAAEVQARWDQTSRRIERFILNPGYTGALVFDGPEVSDPDNFATLAKYKFTINEVPQISHDGGKTWGPFYLKFDAQSGKVDEKYVQALANGMIQTFDPSQKKVDPTTGKPVSCAQSGRCLLIKDTDTPGTLFGVRPVGMYIHFPNIIAPAEIASKPDQMFVTFLKLLPFSSSPMFLKLDEEGPTAILDPIGDLSPGKRCDIRMLMKHKDLVSNCIDVWQDPTANAIGEKKWLGGVAHDDEHFFFNVQAVALQFTSESLAPFDILKDGMLPAADDLATAFQVDVRANGAYLNDSVPGKAPGTYLNDWHGSSAVYWEYARAIQADLNTYLPEEQRHDLGDPACLYPRDKNGNLPPKFDPLAWRPAAGCTGFEGILTLAPANTGKPQFDKLRRKADARALLGINSNIGVGFRPGDPAVLFCSDVDDAIRTSNAGGDPTLNDGCMTGPIWDTSYKRVLQSLGGGDVNKLPATARDRRYFFKQWGIALVKYMRVAGKFGPTNYDAHSPIDLSAVTLDPDALFFDEVGDGNAERVEYVERSFVTATRPPLDFEYEAGVKDGNQRSTHFFQRLDRPERALYTAMAAGDGKATPGKQRLLMPDIFGSQVLKAMGPGCALHTAPCPGDGFGNTVDLSPYMGAFTGSPFAIGSRNLRLVKRYPELREAQIAIPNLTNPHDATSARDAATPTINVLLPWLPKGPGVGYPVAVTGQRDDFVTAGQLDFSGITETFNLEYDYVNADGNVDGIEADDKTIFIRAAQSGDFLGDVFLCQDPRTNDLLRTRMYSGASDIIDWLAAHPGAQDACKIIVKYSPFNNYPDFIVSQANGVRLGINKGGGLGRVVDATLYIPQ